MSRTLPWTRQPLFWAALIFAVGTLVGAHAWRPPLWWIMSTAVFLLSAGFFLRRRLWAAIALVSGGLLWLGALSFQLQGANGMPNEIAPFCDREPVKITAHVVRDGSVRESAFGKLQQTVDLETEAVTGQDCQRVPVTAGVRLVIFYSSEGTEEAVDSGGNPQTFHYGQRLSITGRLRSPRNFGNPGAMDTRAYLLKQGILALLSAKASDIEMLPGRGGSRTGASIASIRRDLLARMNLLWGKQDGPMLAAMLIGERSLVDRETRQDFQRTGTYHILVVSGMNVGLMAFPVIWVLRRMRIGEGVTTAITVLVTGGYVLLTDLGAPVLRAAIMLWIYLVMRLFYRDSRAPLNAIGISALLLLIADPQSLSDPSFQMTFICVLAIGGIGMPLLERTSEPYRRALMFLDSPDYDLHLAPKLAQLRLDLRLIAERLAGFWPGARGERVALWVLGTTGRSLLGIFDVLLISALMQVAMTTPMTVYAHRAAFLTVPSNAVVVPLTALLTPIAMIAMLLSYLSIAIAWLPAKATAILLHGITGSVRLLGGIHASELRVPTPSVAVLVMAGIAFALAMFLVRRRRVVALTGLAVMVGASAWMVLRPAAPQVRQGTLEITAIDVGQGDSLLVVAPDGRTLLVDAGGLTGQGRSNFDLGEDVVSPYLWARGLSRLDAVAISHAHSDHMGGMPAVMANFRPRELWVGVEPPSGELGPILEQARRHGIEVKWLRQGAQIEFGGALVNVLAPALDWKPAKRAHNNDALVLRVSYGGRSALLEGDAEKRVERQIASQADVHADVLKVGHHGSVTSAVPEFLTAVQPRYAVISVGAHNPFRYPRPEVLARMEKSNIAAYRTDAHGAVTFYLDGGGVTATLPNHH